MPGPLFPIQNFVAKPFSGSLQGVNVALLSKGGVTTNDGQTLQPRSQSRVVTAQIDFLSTTYKGQAVTINLQSQNTASPLNQILMIYVDNELNSQDVTVAFPDTQQYIGVPAFTTGYYPVLTGQLIANVYNGTTGKVPVTAASQVSVIFCNFAIPGFLSQETLDVTYNSSTGPVIPSIGDTVETYTLSSTLTPPFIVLPTILAPQQYVITALSLTAINLFITGGMSGGAAVDDPYVAAILLVDTNPLNFNPVRYTEVYMRPEFEGSRYTILFDQTGLNIPVQGLYMYFTDDASNPIPVPPWTRLTVAVTYAKVTL